MKKKLLFLFTALTTLGGVDCFADTYYTTADSDGNSFQFESTDGKTATITWVYLGGSATSLTIPTKVWSNADPYPSFDVASVGAGTYAINNSASAITSLIIAEGITTVNATAFNSWSGLTSVTLPSTLTSVGASAFQNCSALSNITFRSTTAPTFGSNAFATQSTDPYYNIAAVVIVPDGSRTSYYDDAHWPINQIDYTYHHLYEAGSFTIGTEGYATYYNTYGYTMPEGVEGYIITSTAENTAYLAKIYNPGDEVYAGLALIVKSTTDLIESTTYNFNVLASGGNTAAWPVNGESQAYTTLLNGTQTAGETTYWGTSSSDYYYYKLAKGDKGLGWYWGDEATKNGSAFTNGAHKAYLMVPKANAAARSFISMFDDETTGIEKVQEFKSSTGQDNQIYDLQGRRVAQPTKGLYIVNGKKVIK